MITSCVVYSVLFYSTHHVVVLLPICLRTRPVCVLPVPPTKEATQQRDCIELRYIGRMQHTALRSALDAPANGIDANPFWVARLDDWKWLIILACV